MATVREHLLGHQAVGEPDARRDDDQVVEVAEDGDEVGDQVDGRECVEKREGPCR